MKRAATTVFLLLGLFSFISGYSGSGLTLKNDVRNFIVDLADTIVALHPSTGTLAYGGSEGFVYVQGCYVITLVGAYEITGDTSYINEAKRWCHWYIGQQVVYDGGDKGYWVDCSCNGQRYLADTQKGAYALMRTYAHADPALKADILLALRRFLNRIRAGGFIVSPYFYGGSLNVYGDGSGDGYTTATGLGASMWSAYYRLTGDTAALNIGSHNAEWVIRSIEADGLLPMYIWGARQEEGVETIFNAIGYSSFGLSTCWRYTPYLNTRAFFDSGNVGLNIQWLLDRQNAEGIWGAPAGSENQVRTPMIGMYLNWYATARDIDRIDVRRSLRKWYGYLLDHGMYNNNRYRCLAGIFITDLYEKGLPSRTLPIDTGLLFGLPAGIRPPVGDTGDYVHTSDPFFMGDTIQGYGGLYFKANQGVTDTVRSWDVRIQLRSAASEAMLDSVDWTGPTAPDDWYTATGEQINPVHNNKPWIQYRAVLYRSDTAYPVSLDEVIISGKREPVPSVRPLLIPADTSTNDSAGPWEDDFENGGELAWQPASLSRWSLDPDQGDTALHLNTTDYSNTGDRPGEITMLKGVRVRDFDLSVSIRSPEPSSNLYPDYAVLFGYQSPNDFYMLVASKAAQFSEIYHVVNGVRTALVSLNLNMIPDTAYDTIRLLQQDDTLSVFQNDARIAHIGLKLDSLGLVGLGSYNDEAYFDDFSLVSLDPPLYSRGQSRRQKFVLELVAQPNPFQAAVKLALRNGVPENDLRIFNAGGRLVAAVRSRDGFFSWDTGRLPSGVYVARYLDKKVRLERKLVLLR